jgi:hypothetical protein
MTPRVPRRFAGSTTTGDAAPCGSFFGFGFGGDSQAMRLWTISDSAAISCLAAAARRGPGEAARVQLVDRCGRRSAAVPVLLSRVSLQRSQSSPSHSFGVVHTESLSLSSSTRTSIKCLAASPANGKVRVRASCTTLREAVRDSGVNRLPLTFSEIVALPDGSATPAQQQLSLSEGIVDRHTAETSTAHDRSASSETPHRSSDKAIRGKSTSASRSLAKC